MHSSIRQVTIALVCFITFIPYHFIANWLPISLASASSFSLLFFCFQKNTSRSFKLFWQYLLLATLAILVSKLLNDTPTSISQQLYQDFASLFVYFFILLAIETNPHLSDVPLNKYIGGRVPAIFFTLILLLLFYSFTC